MAQLDRETESALDTVRDRYGHTVRPQEAAAIRARRTRLALNGYLIDLADSAAPLLAAAHSALDTLPPADHITAWRDVLDSLARSHAEILRTASQPAEHEQQTVWAHLSHWAEHGQIAAHLADLHHHQPGPEFTPDEAQEWMERAQAAWHRGELNLFESWYAADGRRITLAYLIEDDTSEVIALTGDLDASDWCVIGRYDNELEAGQSLPRPVPPGVLHTDGPSSRFSLPERANELLVEELHRDIIEARCAGDVSEALLFASDPGYSAGPVTGQPGHFHYDVGPMARLQHFIGEAAEFSHALDTVQGHLIGTRLHYIGRQLGHLAREVHEAANDLESTVAVLPPHRVPKPPRIRPRPALETTPPPAPPQHTTATARRP
ncbi:hypothetical protein OIC43_09480 [Streptomyces sp. NBC_00825]|uniref:hypothetical protein n=1 Tax=unclassified Streptomyces TaxID=2593676 RepID=UPI002ED2DBE8|nr:hypothetical protein OG832_34215 [Streptomyces sp. NBC_00826]WTH89253.1 hypothetical protein OIC43_09480 [Streptomyces sp. NBC_00825]WTH97978.1 hypothetical protein OHA23_09465 [Streptomyces sp. NBC_00822]